jgi:hypothetical protein
MKTPDNIALPIFERSNHTCRTIHFQQRVFYKYLRTLKVNKSNGRNGIPARIRKMFASKFAFSIESEPNLSLVEVLCGEQEGLVPLFNTDPTNW